MSEWTRERHFRGRQRRPASGISRHRRDLKFYNRPEQYPLIYGADSDPGFVADLPLRHVRDGSPATEDRAPDTNLDYATNYECHEEPIGGEAFIRDRPLSRASSISSGSQGSETWDTPTRTDSLDTQHSMAENILTSQDIKSAGKLEVRHCGWQDEVATDMEHLKSAPGESESEGEDTPCGSSDGEMDFSTEEEADDWLASHFSREEVQSIKAAWTWSTDHANWIHRDETTGAVVEWPKDLV
jgi:hypothetical protein